MNLGVVLFGRLSWVRRGVLRGLVPVSWVMRPHGSGGAIAARPTMIIWVRWFNTQRLHEHVG